MALARGRSHASGTEDRREGGELTYRGVGRLSFGSVADVWPECLA